MPYSIRSWHVTVYMKHLVDPEHKVPTMLTSKTDNSGLRGFQENMFLLNFHTTVVNLVLYVKQYKCSHFVYFCNLSGYGYYSVIHVYIQKDSQGLQRKHCLKFVDLVPRNVL